MPDELGDVFCDVKDMDEVRGPDPDDRLNPIREVIKEVIKEVPSKFNKICIRWANGNRQLDIWINGIRVVGLGLNMDMTIACDVLHKPSPPNPNYVEIQNVKEFKEWLSDMRVREVLEGPPPTPGSFKKRERRELLE